jgi:hypothetical protein
MTALNAVTDRDKTGAWTAPEGRASAIEGRTFKWRPQRGMAPIT